MTPLIKWAGGKSWLLPEIVKRMPHKYGRYFEPFAGGAALFFHLEPEKAVLGDMNEHVINTYKTIKHSTISAEIHLLGHVEDHNKRHYYRTRAVWNRTFWTQPDTVHGIGNQWGRRTAQFLYLNRTCFNGLWRENKAGKMNVPMGRYKNPRIYDAALLESAQRVLKNADLMVLPFWTTVMTAKKGDFVYMDSPYDPISATSSFTAYSHNAFGRAEQKKLVEVVDELSDKGVNVMISNSNTRWVREQYRGYDITKVYRPGTMSSKKDGRGRVAELLIRTY